MILPVITALLIIITLLLLLFITTICISYGAINIRRLLADSF